MLLPRDFYSAFEGAKLPAQPTIAHSRVYTAVNALHLLGRLEGRAGRLNGAAARTQDAHCACALPR